MLPASLAAGQALYARVEAKGTGSEELTFSTGRLDEVLLHGADHTRMITLAFGALMAMALTSLLIWFVLSDRILIYYAVLFSMQALYIAFFSARVRLAGALAGIASDGACLERTRRHQRRSGLRIRS